MTGMRPFVVSVLILVGAPPALALAELYVPAAAADVPGYFPEALPCTVSAGNLEGHRLIEIFCKDKHPFDGKTLRELAIMRNTIYARYGWDGFRKQWLRDYFRAQKWFKAQPRVQL